MARLVYALLHGWEEALGTTCRQPFGELALVPEVAVELRKTWLHWPRRRRFLYASALVGGDGFREIPAPGLDVHQLARIRYGYVDVGLQVRDDSLYPPR